MSDRPDVPDEWIESIDRIVAPFPQVVREPAWVGTRWRVGSATVGMIFGGEDQLIRLTFRADPQEVMAFENLGPPYFRAGWGSNVVGLVLSERTDWTEVAEMLMDSYCLQAPAKLAGQVQRPGGGR